MKKILSYLVMLLVILTGAAQKGIAQNKKVPASQDPSSIFYGINPVVKTKYLGQVTADQVADYIESDGVKDSIYFNVPADALGKEYQKSWNLLKYDDNSLVYDPPLTIPEVIDILRDLDDENAADFEGWNSSMKMAGWDIYSKPPRFKWFTGDDRNPHKDEVLGMNHGIAHVSKYCWNVIRDYNRYEPDSSEAEEEETGEDGEEVLPRSKKSTGSTTYVVPKGEGGDINIDINNYTTATAAVDNKFNNSNANQNVSEDEGYNYSTEGYDNEVYDYPVQRYRNYDSGLGIGFEVGFGTGYNYNYPSYDYRNYDRRVRYRSRNHVSNNHHHYQHNNNQPGTITYQSPQGGPASSGPIDATATFNPPNNPGGPAPSGPIGGRKKLKGR